MCASAYVCMACCLVRTYVRSFVHLFVVRGTFVGALDAWIARSFAHSFWHYERFTKAARFNVFE